MSEAALTEVLIEEIKGIRQVLVYIIEHMVDADSTLTSEGQAMLDESIRAHREGRSVKLQDFRRYGSLRCFRFF